MEDCKSVSVMGPYSLIGNYGGLDRSGGVWAMAKAGETCFFSLTI